MSSCNSSRHRTSQSAVCFIWSLFWFKVLERCTKTSLLCMRGKDAHFHGCYFPTARPFPHWMSLFIYFSINGIPLFINETTVEFSKVCIRVPYSAIIQIHGENTMKNCHQERMWKTSESSVTNARASRVVQMRNGDMWQSQKGEPVVPGDGSTITSFNWASVPISPLTDGPREGPTEASSGPSTVVGHHADLWGRSHGGKHEIRSRGT